MMAKVALVLGCILPLVLHCQISSDDDGGRWRRQAAAGGHNHSIPVSLSFYDGVGQVIDSCRRSEAQFPGGACYHLLTQGPCQVTEFVLLDPDTNRGYCAPRLCAPDRIFVFNDQLCHDPNDAKLCPPGRRLYYTAYGTPICQCPPGTYEAKDDLNENVCQHILTRTSLCPINEVLWARDFSVPWKCLPDPCGGVNLERGPSIPPFVPSSFNDSKCYQLRQTRGVCPAPTFYSLALEPLQGVCSKLQDAGYEVFDTETFGFLKQFYGPPISSIPVTGSPGFSAEVSGSVSTSSSEEGSTSQSRSNLKVVKLDPIARVKGIMEALNGAFPNLDVFNLPVHHKLYAFMERMKVIIGDLLSRRDSDRSRRQAVLDTTTFATALIKCNPGAVKDLNLKCKEIIDLKDPPNILSTSARPPVPPEPPCPNGQVRSVKNRCTIAATGPINNDIFG